jgi:hypothetical protein
MSLLINKDGQPCYGLHPEPLKELNIRDFKPGGSQKQWIFLGASCREAVFGLAIVNLGYLANLFAYVFDRQSGRITEQRDIIVPFGLGTSFAGSGAAGSVSFSSGGATAGIVINSNMMKLDAELGSGFSAGLVYARISDSLNLVTRNGLNGFNYTSKEAGLSVQGRIKAGGKEYVMDPAFPSGNLDYTFGVLKRSTFWNWASGGGLTENGRHTGFNFAQGMNETGFTENAFWVNGKMAKVDSVHFDYARKNLLAPWKLKSTDGKVDLLFTPEGERAKNLNLLLIKSYYHQPFGTFTGTLSDGKETYKLKEVYGFTEEHDAVW